jgi:hypothetical protein
MKGAAARRAIWWMVNGNFYGDIVLAWDSDAKNKYMIPIFPFSSYMCFLKCQPSLFAYCRIKFMAPGEESTFQCL